MYDRILDFSQRPKPFSQSTVKRLWTRPHIAQQMLQFHLNQETDLASRRFETIERIVQFLDDSLSLSNKSLCDLGCGPGLYAKRFAARGARVTGIDFSAHSLAYAEQDAEQAGRTIRYLKADYLLDTLPTGFDVVTLIYCDLCALAPEQRSRLLKRMRRMLNPGGRVVLDVAGMGSYVQKEEDLVMEERLMGGFWAP
ncbi:MAG: methyltransferase domain-containing protein, partial [Magnetococcales bacterium]|nr:methyltransferase domain-containing protein [Magnetococcales bacterium]